MPQYVELPCPVVARREKTEANAGTQFSIFYSSAMKKQLPHAPSKLGASFIFVFYWSSIHTDTLPPLVLNGAHPHSLVCKVSST